MDKYTKELITGFRISQKKALTALDPEIDELKTKTFFRLDLFLDKERLETLKKRSCWVF